jgi:hypothetical protein
MSLTKFSLGGNNLIIPAQGEFGKKERKKERIFIYLPYTFSLKCHMESSNIYIGALRGECKYDICHTEMLEHHSRGQ